MSCVAIAVVSPAILIIYVNICHDWSNEKWEKVNAYEEKLAALRVRQGPGT